VNVRWALLTAALLIHGCSEAERAPRLDQPGDPCRGSDHSCVDDHQVTRCEANILVETSCDEVCAALGPAWIADGCDRRCVCVPADPSGCWPGETACVNEQTLEQCDEDQSWAPVDCEERCADLSSLGCVEQTDDLTDELSAACWCSGEATPCDPAAPPTCVDETSIATCEDGAWLVQDCAELCGGPSPCVPWQTPAACAC